MLIAEQIRKWYLEYKQHKSGKKIAKVLIVGKNGERLILEGATAEQIQRIFNLVVFRRLQLLAWGLNARWLLKQSIK